MFTHTPKGGGIGHLPVRGGVIHRSQSVRLKTVYREMWDFGYIPEGKVPLFLTAGRRSGHTHHTGAYP